MEDAQRPEEQDKKDGGGSKAMELSSRVSSIDDAVLVSARLQQDVEPLKELSPLANQIVETAIDNMTRKLVAGYRNKDNAKPNAKEIDFGAETKEALKAATARSVLEVANRGQAWKEMIQKSLSHGISSISTLQFDGEFQIKGGQRPTDFKSAMPRSPGVYVVYDNKTSKPVYIGDSENMQSRWNAGHFNEFQQGQRPGGERYKLADEFESGCTVKYIRMETKESAAALEAHLIRENFDNFRGVAKTGDNLDAAKAQTRDEALENGMLKNKRGELETEQGTRSNQEAKKMKDASGSTASLAMGAAAEAAKNAGYDLFQRLSTTIIKAVKDELVDILHGGKARIVVRIERLLRRILAALKGVLDNALALLRGLVEFIVNAISKTIGQIYNLARNIFDLASGAWKLYQGSKTMTREELVRKISETIIASGTLVLWDALDPVIEAQLGFLGPFAPYVSAAVCAVGFGLSSYALQSFVVAIIDAVVAFKQGLIKSLEASRAACEQLIRLAEKELELLADLGEYVKTSLALMDQMRAHTDTLSSHQPILPIDIQSLLPSRT